jgi:hypothetical protein
VRACSLRQAPLVSFIIKNYIPQKGGSTNDLERAQSRG